MLTLPRRTALASVFLLFAAPVLGAPAGIEELVVQLQDASADFRLRVQAALQLGKSMDPAALKPLVDALDDQNASVRAAAVAALEALGDKRAVEPLKEHRLDRSPAVRNQIKSSLAALDVQSPRCW